LKKVALYSILGLFLAGGGLYTYAYRYLSGPVYRGPQKPHFDGEQFHNLEPTEMKGLMEVLKWQLNRDRGNWPDEKQKTEAQVPRDSVAGGKTRVTFINHATLLLQGDGLNILTDPIWSERASPMNWAGPERLREPGVRFEELPSVDVVIISHNHYDHLDLPTLQRLKEVHDPLFIVPLGVDLLLMENELERVVALDWFDSRQIQPETRITSVPVRHFSGRGLGDTNQTLWSGYVVEFSGRNVFFAGDTGYGGFFDVIRDNFSGIDIALLPIGAYQPRWFMQPIHMSPEEAVQAHKDLDAGKSIAIHFGTFPMADDGQEEPVEDLKKALDKLGVSDEDFRVLKEGEWLEVE
jgi:L-ascorbate metabolism protein UlaG (beta-lactamase superfamily)